MANSSNSSTFHRSLCTEILAHNKLRFAASAKTSKKKSYYQQFPSPFINIIKSSLIRIVEGKSNSNNSNLIPFIPPTLCFLHYSMLLYVFAFYSLLFAEDCYQTIAHLIVGRACFPFLLLLLCALFSVFG